MVDEKKGNYAIVAIIAIVAIVALIVLVSGNKATMVKYVETPAEESTISSNIGGAAVSTGGVTYCVKCTVTRPTGTIVTDMCDKACYKAEMACALLGGTYPDTGCTKHVEVPTHS